MAARDVLRLLGVKLGHAADAGHLLVLDFVRRPGVHRTAARLALASLIELSRSSPERQLRRFAFAQLVVGFLLGATASLQSQSRAQARQRDGRPAPAGCACSGAHRDRTTPAAEPSASRSIGTFGGALAGHGSIGAGGAALLDDMRELVSDERIAHHRPGPELTAAERHMFTDREGSRVQTVGDAR